MESKSSAYYQRLYRQRLREQGLVKKEIWILPKHSGEVGKMEQKLRQPTLDANFMEKEQGMNTLLQAWTANTLHEKLSSHLLFTENHASIEMLEGSDPILRVTMHDYGDLPLFIAVSGEQIIVEGVLWEIGMVKDIVKFNDVVLRTHKLFPLSSIALEVPAQGSAYYIMFGALSATSWLENIVIEIEMLADNIIKATEAYMGHLKETV